MPSGPSLKVTHYQFKGWPDHSVPECAGELLSLINRIGATDGITEGAILVHCRYRYSGSHLKCSVYVLAVEYRKTRAHTFTPISRSAINPYLHGFCNCTVHRYCLRHFYIEVIVKMASFSSYHFIPASLPTRKAPELQKLVARQSKD